MPHGNYNGDDVQVCFSCKMKRDRSDIVGVPDTWDIDHRSVEILTLTILGLDVQLSSLPADLQDAIWDLHTEVEFDE
jgi:hypothetical protein